MKRWFIPVLAMVSLCLAVFSVARTKPDHAPEPPPILHRHSARVLPVSVPPVSHAQVARSNRRPPPSEA